MKLIITSLSNNANCNNNFEKINNTDIDMSQTEPNIILIIKKIMKLLIYL